MIHAVGCWFNKALSFVAALLFTSFSSIALAAQDNAPASPLLTSPVSKFAQAAFGLVVVLGLIFLMAWALKKLGGQSGFGLPAHAKVVGNLMVGPRERVVIVEIDQSWLVLGVAQGAVNLLHTLPRPADADTIAPVSFAERLRTALTHVKGQAAHAQDQNRSSHE